MGEALISLILLFVLILELANWYFDMMVILDGVFVMVTVLQQHNGDMGVLPCVHGHWYFDLSFWTVTS